MFLETPSILPNQCDPHFVAHYPHHGVYVVANLINADNKPKSGILNHLKPLAVGWVELRTELDAQRRFW